LQAETRWQDKQHSANTLLFIKLSLLFSIAQIKGKIPPLENKGHQGLQAFIWKQKTVYAPRLTQPSIPLGTEGIPMITHNTVRTYRLYKQKHKV